MKKLSVILLFITISATCKSQGVDSQCVSDGSGFNCYPINHTYTPYPPDTTKMWFMLFPYTINPVDSSIEYIDTDKEYYLGYSIYGGGEYDIPYIVDLNFKPFDWGKLEFQGGEAYEFHIHDHDRVADSTATDKRF